MSLHLVFLLPSFVYRDVTVALVGVMANWILYGVLLVQVFLFYAGCSSKDKNSLTLQLVVLAELLLDTIQTIAISRDAFRFFTIGFTNLIFINQIGETWFSVPLITGLIAFVTQGFYCYRTAILTKSRYAVGLIIVLSLCQLASSITVAIQARNGKLLTNVLSNEMSLVTIGVWGGTGVACDVFIAAVMTYYLKLQEQETLFQQTRDILNRVIRLTIETGSITASFAVLSLILVYLPGHPPYYQVAALILAKTYSISTVAAVNSRMKVYSNAGSTSAPVWNESATTVTLSTRSNIQGLEFRRPIDTTISTSSASSV